MLHIEVLTLRAGDQKKAPEAFSIHLLQESPQPRRLGETHWVGDDKNTQMSFKPESAPNTK